jgi:hypothetical protein
MPANLEVPGGIPTGNNAGYIRDQQTPTPITSALAIGQNRVGIGITSPAAKLEVSGTTLVNGGNANLGVLGLPTLINTAKMLIGWNYTDGEGEADFFTNRSIAGTAGGYRFYDVDSSGNIRLLLKMNGNGEFAIGYDSGASSPSIVMVPRPTTSPTENRVNIQAAINLVANNGGGTVILQKGRYVLEKNTGLLNNNCCIQVREGVNLVGAGMQATILDAGASNCNVIESDPATWAGDRWAVKLHISIRDLCIQGGANSAANRAIFLRGVQECFVENIFVSGIGNKFWKGICIQGWVNTIIGCWVRECIIGFDLSFEDENYPDLTNATYMAGCHYEGGTLTDSLTGCYINGSTNSIIGCTFEKRLEETSPPESLINSTGVEISGTTLLWAYANTFVGCYFEHMKTNFKLSYCKNTNVTGGSWSRFENYPAVVYATAEMQNFYNCNNFQNIEEGVLHWDTSLNPDAWVAIANSVAGIAIMSGLNVSQRLTSLLGSGVVTFSGATLNGTGTNFVSELRTGDKVTVNGAQYTVIAITSNSQMTVDRSGTGSNYSYTIQPASMRIVNYNYSATQLIVADGGNVGLNQTNPAEKLDVSGNVKSSGQFMLGNVRIGVATSNPTTAEWKYKGCLYINTSDGKLRINTAADSATPNWVVVGTQS